MSTSKLRKYVEKDKFRKLDAFLKDHRKAVNEVINRKGQTGLHVAAKLGHADSLRILLKHKAKVDIQDKKGCFPLHYACKFCLKHYSSGNVSDLVSSLLTFSTDILDLANKKGTTCRVLVKALDQKQRWLT